MRKTMLLWAAASLAVLTLSGCLSTRSATSDTPGQVPRNAHIVVEMPANGKFKDIVYEKSGTQVAGAVTTALRPYFASVSTGAAKPGAYTIKPAILHWEDRATFWSDLPDRVRIGLTTYNSAGRLVDSSEIAAKSSYWTLGGDHPEKLIHQPLGTYAQRLAGSQ